MPNTTNAFGLRVLERQEGGAPTMGQTKWVISSGDANSFYTGDLVAIASGTGGTVTLHGGSSMQFATVGVFNGCEYYNTAQNKQVWDSKLIAGSATGPVSAYVLSDPNLWFTVQMSSANIGSSSPTIGSSAIGYNLTFLTASNGAGSNLSGVSALTLASSIGYTQASSLPLRVVDVWSNYAPPGVNGTDNSSNQNYQVLVVKGNGWFLGYGSSISLQSS